MAEVLIGLLVTVLLIWLACKSGDDKLTLLISLIIYAVGAIAVSVIAIVTGGYLYFVFVGMLVIMIGLICVLGEYRFRDLKSCKWIKKLQTYTKKADNNEKKADICDLHREIIDYCALLIDKYEGDGESPSCKMALLSAIQQNLDTGRGIFKEIPTEKYGIMLIMRNSIELIGTGSFHYLKGELDIAKPGIKMVTLCMNLASYSLSCHLLEDWEARDYIRELNCAIKTAW